ncbi:POU domain, class 3, transcription factor 2-like isoform X2 [Oryza brachyantha]|uniref:POU domain, class 3, transcription factor 2-like isoform X2 n=1 Tax=Oryza brachyantha TaxID=4533 RepID=UPI001ADD1B60|nr:POU domain, class 3, transcription factor 2-like isoform X2 [Oryza brachyantha]
MAHGLRMAPSATGPVTDRRLGLSLPPRRLLVAVALVSSVLALLPGGVHGAHALDDGKEAREVSSSRTTMAARWSVAVREGGGGHGGGGHAGGGHSGGTGHGSGHGRTEPAGHNTHRRSAAPGRDLCGPSSPMAAALLAAAALLRF